MIVRRDNETDEDAWAGYLERRRIGSASPAPAGRGVFISQVDVLA